MGTVLECSERCRFYQHWRTDSRARSPIARRSSTSSFWSKGVEVYNDAVTQIRAWRAQGIRTAIVSSSKNCAAVLWAAGLTDRFEVRVDGLDAERLGLVGKPAPDIFLEAARQLGIEPRRAVVIEDALAGVRAGRNGGFGLLVGVDRTGIQASALRENGADLVVVDLTQLQIVDGAADEGAR